jgi:predicted site-specific integrase-resolvase
MNKPVPTSTAATAPGVSISTLRRWDITGKPKPARTEGRQKRYDLSDLLPALLHGRTATRKSIAYARVSSHDQKADLERQKQVLELYCASRGWTLEIIADLGWGMNYHAKGLKKLHDEILAGQVGHPVLTHKDRLLR